MPGKEFIYSENKKIRRKNKAFYSVFWYKLHLSRAQQLMRKNISFQKISSGKCRRNGKVPHRFAAPTRQWIWGMTINIHTETTGRSAGGDASRAFGPHGLTGTSTLSWAVRSTTASACANSVLLRHGERRELRREELAAHAH